LLPVAQSEEIFNLFSIPLKAWGKIMAAIIMIMAMIMIVSTNVNALRGARFAE
jgi:hypothetical protein